jgi:uncharacterized protein YraI
MPKRLLIAVAMLVPLLAGGEASAAQPVAVATADVNLRAGPGTQYPAVAIIPYGDSVSLFGCTSAFTWCDIAWGNARGWVAAAYLQVIYRGAPVVVDAGIAPRIGVNVVVFNRDYWARHYVGRPWSRDWNVYVTRSR